MVVYICEVCDTLDDEENPKADPIFCLPHPDVVGEVVSALYEGNDYSDIIYFYENNEFNTNQTILYHYGVSLYMTRKYKNQLKIY